MKSFACVAFQLPRILLVVFAFVAQLAFSSEMDELTIKANQDDVGSQLLLGHIYTEGKVVPQDYKQAVYWYSKAAQQGNASAQYNLGYVYANGEGVTQDYKQAVYWYAKAAEQGHATAQFNLGVMYQDGQGVLQDYKQVVYWHAKAAEQGHAGAQLLLGLMYAMGRGVSQDYNQAYIWLSIAYVNGVDKAKEPREMAASKLTPQALEQAQQEAKILYEKIEANKAK